MQKFRSDANVRYLLCAHWNISLLLLVIVWSGVQLTIKSRVTKELRKNFTESEGRGEI